MAVNAVETVVNERKQWSTMQLDDESGKPSIKRKVVGTRYPADRIALLDAVQARWGKPSRGDVIEAALDRLLVSEGLLEAA